MEHQHDHGHACGCGCGHDHGHENRNGEREPAAIQGLSANQTAFLHQLLHSRYLPVARFVVESSREEDFCAVALEPVFIRATGDSLEAVKEAGAFLTGLEEKGLLTLDYDIPLEGYGYEEYRACALFQYFQDTVRQGAGKPGFLGDTAALELGSMALTPEAEDLLEAAFHW